ncbi:MAG TPA: hypothetical protein VHG89_09445 [Verrucomicrobiae bacterium]|nr:hypothetical protein [Verrucomicrobiae bacterium]
MKCSVCIAALMLAANCLRAELVSAERTQIFNQRNFPGSWTLTTNQDNTVTATENAIRRQSDEVFRRVLTLRQVSSGQLTDKQLSEAMTTWPLNDFAVTPELLNEMRHAAGETDIRNFIKQYRPPAIPYTSETAAKKTGAEKFECVEFAEDLVAQARAKGIPAEMVGILFDGQATGHACAGFPTTGGKVLYFDSTPGAGQISRRARESWVEIGQPYREAGGGELAGAGKHPVVQIMPDMNQLEKIIGINSATAVAQSLLVVAEEAEAQVTGVEYAGTNTLQVSAAQLAKWNRAAQKMADDNAISQKIQKQLADDASQKAAAKALQQEEKLAMAGDTFGLLRMGERYLSGDGVAKDSAKARIYLQRAADAGSPTAAEDLQRLAQAMAE